MQLYSEGKTTWVTHIKGMLLKYRFGEVWIWQGVGDERVFVESFLQCMKDSFKQEWHSTLRVRVK